MSAGAKSPQPAIQHMRHSRQRMPIAGMLAAKCVDKSVDAQPTGDGRIRINVPIIVEIDEVVTDSLAKHQPRNCNQENTNTQSLAACRRPSLWCASKSH